MKRGYSLAQIGLHWLVALMVPVQYLTGGSIERTHHAAHMGITPSSWDVVQHHLHNYAGIAIGLLMGVRLVLHVLQPSEASVPGTWAGRAATVLHHAFYAAIIGQACMGFVASYFWFGIAPYHVIGSRIILAMVALHLAAAAWHTLIARDETVDRIVFPRRKRSAQEL
ncbi:cytochrome b/b6 domain-containing protein [Rhizobium hidalgonense]|uniref:Cytochrome b/b6 domain-containing protein n=1 Tax=Rhizobium hidalgonense TaxID=1538159 RepID=A0AAJ2LL96_9HYPH|nr:cytochrome b/b6 domain-containing protein [Rhizobium hidalgonense]MDR9772966.1 cytochrome b/b6 domain-containing protein [Rhizobium hidalgonense]MDR9807137.1 cytochrome b/b6 domain-containing protein [Rhizobium hidalgonense]MDR9813585.1 cytochrome b/b6 domain-containing protein [Rhizobium hidalgonense]MDR9822019.1 cytochrome b/b6 domain-containing protein [Rhizobium hidalgonense]QKK27570.1 cytochrome b/b6 domain-containing protein [Rhizobium hidalgonense]